MVLYPYRHFTSDDAHVSFRFAENLARGDGFSFNPGHPTYGSRSPLWVGLLALGCSAGLDVRTAGHALDAFFVGAAVLVWSRLTRVYLGGTGWRALAMAVFVLDPWFFHGSMLGTENPVALALLGGALLGWQRQGRSGVPGIAAPICCG